MKEILAGLALLATVWLLGEVTEAGTQWVQAILGGSAAFGTISFTISAAVDRVAKVGATEAKEAQK